MKSDLKKTVLSISPTAEDHQTLKTIFRQRSRRNNEWKLLTASNLDWATELLRHNQIRVAVCERDLEPGTWRDILAQNLSMAHSPLLIVTSRLADERLWSEVLNLGAWDLLAKPFDSTEVTRVVEAALRQWSSEHDLPAGGIHLAASRA